MPFLRDYSLPEPVTGGLPFAEEDKPWLDANGVLATLLAIAIAAGGYLNDSVRALSITRPEFVTALFAGILLSSTMPALFPGLPWPAGSARRALISEISVGLFLAVSLTSLDLASLAGAALPPLAALLVQFGVTWILLSHVVFRLPGGSYDAAVAASGHFGRAPGPMPTAVAIMTATTKTHGASTRSFLVVPLVGEFFVDIANAAIRQGFVFWPGRA